METAVAPPDRAPSRGRALALIAGGVGLAVVVAFIYRDALGSYFFNDDFQWLQGARVFALPNVLHIERYNHFYRPVIEIYFHVGRRLFGCEAFPFHVASIAIHLLNTAFLFLFARVLTRSTTYAGLAAVFFAVQPGHAQAVAWVGAITDLLPATWYLLAMWMWASFLKGPKVPPSPRHGFGGASRGSEGPKVRALPLYAVALVAFALCLLTHESSATLLPMMIALEATVLWERGERPRLGALARRAARYVPFALLLAGYLAIAYDVNSRSYLVREGHYQFGWHAVPHAIHYLITLYVGTRGLASQLFVVAAVAALLVRGSPRIRFLTLWMIVTIAPASFFTWGNVSRYLYLPAAGFALLLADALFALQRVAARRTSARTARSIVVVVALLLAVRFAMFAQKVPAGFREWTRPYERYAAAVRIASAAAPSATTIVLDRADLEGIQVLYRDPAAEVAVCGVDLHVVPR